MRREASLEGVQIGDVVGGAIRPIAPQATHHLRQRGIGDERPVIRDALRVRQCTDAVQLARDGAMIRHASHYSFVKGKPHVSECTRLYRRCDAGRPLREVERELIVREWHGGIEVSGRGLGAVRRVEVDFPRDCPDRSSNRGDPAVRARGDKQTDSSGAHQIE